MEGLGWSPVEAEAAADLSEYYACDGLCGMREVQAMGETSDSRWAYLTPTYLSYHDRHDNPTVIMHIGEMDYPSCYLHCFYCQ